MADGDSSTSTGNGGGSNGGGGRSFTEADVERIVRDRLDRDRRKQEDAARAATDAQKSDIEKLTASVQALTDRAAKAEAAVARRDVAEKYNLPKNIAAKLTGSAEDELDREARDWVTQLAELGVPVKDGKIVGKQGGSDSSGAGGGDNGNGGDSAGGNANGSGQGGNAQGGGDGKDGGGQGSTGGDGADAGKNNGNGGSGRQDSGGDAGKGRSLLGGRPTENLRSGATPAGGDQGVDAGKLADSILGRAL